MNPAESPGPVWLARLKDWVGVGSLIKTALGLLIGAAGAVYGVYEHFAKASELIALRQEQIRLVRGLSCDLASQVYISGLQNDANRAISSALSELKMVRSIDELPRVISDAVAGVDKALARLTDERERVLANKIPVGGAECSR